MLQFFKSMDPGKYFIHVSHKDSTFHTFNQV